ncbi:MAG: IS5 family transposase [Hyphomicrobiaceae bacterium]|nr:IS5 family transposase [Hyphomicrobiaceae bacterium]
MRGSDSQNGSLFSYVNLDERIPARHPLRKIKDVVDAALADLDADFAPLYAAAGRPSIAPERLLRAALVQILFSIRSETQLMEQLDYNLLYRWFVGLSIDEAVWVPTVFTKNRDRLLNADIARKLMSAILVHERVAPLLSDDHFSVDGTLIEAWASFKSFKPKAGCGRGDPPNAPPPPDAGNSSGMGTTEATAKAYTAEAANKMTVADMTAMNGIGRNVERDWRGQTWSNATHASITDPDARLYRKAKGRPAQLCYMGHAITENRNGFVVETTLTYADGTAERRAAITMLDALDPGSTRRITLGADKGYDAAEFVEELRMMCVTPHIAAKAKGSAIDGRTTRHPGYAVSQRKRKLVEEPFGWGKTVGPIRKTMLRGMKRVCAQFTLTMAAYNLAKLPGLLAG